ncbi:MAG: hypothetical protein WCH46_04700 [bacterium]
MNYLIILLSAAGLVGVGWLYRRTTKSTTHLAQSKQVNEGVRRINANERDEIRSKTNLFTSQSGNENRRFFIDIKEDANGKKFMSISELKKELGGEKGFTIVILNHEIEGFKKAFERSYGFMKG